jgi:hypothetical protein
LDEDLDAYYSNNVPAQNVQNSESVQNVQPQENPVPAMEQVPANPVPDAQQAKVTNMGELVAPQQAQSTVC